MRTFRRLAFFTTLATYFLIFVGGLVRVAGAGLGCPDWPKCFGRWIPPLSEAQLPPEIDPATFNVTLAWIEYINRLVGVVVGLLIVATAVLAIVHFRKHPRILVATLLAGLLVGFQGWLGAAVVASELQPLIVTLHLLLALVIVSLLVYVNQETYHLQYEGEQQETVYPARAWHWAAILWAAGFVQVLLGTEVRSALELVTRDSPLMTVSEKFSQIGLLDDIHLILGVALAVFTYFVAFSLLKGSRQPTLLVKQMMWLLVWLMTGQVVLGLALLIIGLSPVIQLFHLWLASIYVGVALVLFMALRQKKGQVIETRRSFARIIVNTTIVICVMAIGALAVVKQADRSRQDIPKLYEVPQFTFTERNEEPFGLEDMKGKINIVDFFFTSCRGPCPVMVVRMAQLYDMFEGAEEVQFVSITVDPDTDTPEVMRKYAQEHGVTDNRWVFIRGTMEETSRLAEEGFKVSGDLPGMHSTKFILVDQEGWIRGYYSHNDDASLRALREAVIQLAKDSD